MFMGKLAAKDVLTSLLRASQVLTTVKCFKCPQLVQTPTRHFWILLRMIGRIGELSQFVNNGTCSLCA